MGYYKSHRRTKRKARIAWCCCENCTPHGLLYTGAKMWKLWKWDGQYIIGDLISNHKSESAAIKKAKKEINFKKQTKEIIKNEIIIWLDDEDGTPMGAIVKSIKGTKRIRQGKKEE